MKWEIIPYVMFWKHIQNSHLVYVTSFILFWIVDEWSYFKSTRLINFVVAGTITSRFRFNCQWLSNSQKTFLLLSVDGMRDQLNKLLKEKLSLLNFCPFNQYHVSSPSFAFNAVLFWIFSYHQNSLDSFMPLNPPESDNQSVTFCS